MFSNRHSVGSCLLLATCLFLPVLLLSGCGPGAGPANSTSGGGTSSPPPSPDFVLNVSPGTSSVGTGNSTSVSLSVTALNGFSSQVSVQVSGLPSGVTAQAGIAVTPGTPQQMNLSAAANAPAVSGQLVTFTGTSGSLSHTAQLSLSVLVPLTRIPPSRTRYLRTDAVTEYFADVNTHWIIYNPITSQFFVTDPDGNRLFVLDSTTETEVGVILVPGAYSVDDTPDHKTLYVGTLIGDIYTIDVATLAVTHRYLGSQIGPYGYQASSAVVMASGSVALLGAQGGIPSVDGETSFAIWNPTNNAITIYGGGQAFGVPTQPNCVGNIGGFTRTADRTHVILSSIDSDGTLCEVDESTGQENYVGPGGFRPLKIITSPDGNYIALPSATNGINEVALYDAHTLNFVSMLNVSGDVSSADGLVFSADSKTLFVPNSVVIYAYSITTGQLTGWVPNLTVEATSGGFTVGPYANPFLQAIDGTGLYAGPMEEGVGFIDLSSLNTGPVGTIFTNGYLNPQYGPVSGGTQTQFEGANSIPVLSQVYFGGQAAPAFSGSKVGVTATTPPGPPGPVDVYAYSTDGGVQIVPEGFSYSPTILEVTPDKSTSEGGGTGLIFGYGFVSGTATTLPPDLQVSVGGKLATIVGFNPLAYDLEAPPFLLQLIAFTIPPGQATSADVTVTNNSGSTTAAGAITYLSEIQQFHLPNMALAQGIYDPYRNLYYFTDTNQVQVFSKAQGAWLPPWSIPMPQGATAQRLWGIALSPDGNNLAIADANAGVIYFLNPSSPASIKAFPIPQTGSSGIVAYPAGVSVSDAGIVYYEAAVEGGTGFHGFFKLNTSTGSVTDYGIDGPGLGSQDLLLRSQISSDNSRVFFNEVGAVFSIDTATDTIFRASDGQGCCYGTYELTLAPNQTQLSATEYEYDSDLNGQSYLTMNDREALGAPEYVYGAKLSPDGSLLFQPSVAGIDVFDGWLGNLRTRIALPVALSTNYDALVSDGQDNILVAITGQTGSGIAIVDLSSLAEPPPLPYKSDVLLSRLDRANGQAVMPSLTKPLGGNGSPTLHSRSMRHVTGPNPLLQTR